MATEKKIIEVQIDIRQGLEALDRLAKQYDLLIEKNSQIAKLTKAEMGAVAKQLADEEKLRQKKLDTLIKEEKLEQQRLATEAKKLQASTKAQAAQDKANKQSKVTEGYLNQLQQEVKELEMAYYRLSEAQFKGSEGKALLENLKRQRAALAAAQADYGKYSMNVGNYASATNMLAINVGQVMKEMPNFAISARTGIMALTNNLPMLAEAIKAVRVQQQMMIAEGQKAPSMFKLIAGSVFGLTGVMSILMVLLQVFGGRFIEMVGNLFKSEDALKANIKKMYELKTAVEVYHDTMKNGGGVYRDAITSIDKHKTALNAARGNSVLAKKALDEYNKSLGVTFGQATNVNEALLNIKKSEKAYIEAMKNMALSNAFFSYSADKAIQVMEAQSKTNAEVLGDSSKEYIKNIEKAQKRLRDGATELIHVYNNTGQKVLTAVQIPENRLRTELNMAVKAYNDAAKKARDVQISEINASQEKALEHAKKFYNNWAKIMTDNNFKITEEQKDQTLRSFDFETKILAETAKANEENLARDIESLRANYSKKRKDAQDHITYLEGLARKGDKKAKAELIKARAEFNDYMIALTEAETQQEFDIVEKYIDKRIKLQYDLVRRSQKMLEDSLAYDEWLGDKSLQNLLKMKDIERRNQTNMLQDELVIYRGNLQDEFDIQAEMRVKQMEMELAAANITKEQEKAIRDKFRRLEEDAETELMAAKWERMKMYFDSVGQLWSNFNGFLENLGKRELAAYAETIAGKANYDELYAEKKLQLEIAAAKREKALGIFGATIDTASSIMRIWADKIPTAAKIAMTVLAAATGAAQIAKIASTPLPTADLKSSGNKGQKITTSEKFHTGTYRPASKDEEKEITRTLLTTERVLSPTQTTVFDNIINRMQAMGGSDRITSDIGVSQYMQEKMIERAFSKALQNMPAPVMSWREFENQAYRQKRLRNNATIR